MLPLAFKSTILKNSSLEFLKAPKKRKVRPHRPYGRLPRGVLGFYRQYLLDRSVSGNIRSLKPSPSYSSIFVSILINPVSIPQKNFLFCTLLELLGPISAPSWPHLGPCWPHLAQSWPILAPSWSFSAISWHIQACNQGSQ